MIYGVPSPSYKVCVHMHTCKASGMITFFFCQTVRINTVFSVTASAHQSRRPLATWCSPSAPTPGPVDPSPGGWWDWQSALLWCQCHLTRAWQCTSAKKRQKALFDIRALTDSPLTELSSHGPIPGFRGRGPGSTRWWFPTSVSPGPRCSH